MPSLTNLYQINETNLNLRKQLLRFDQQTVEVLKQLAGWGERVAAPIASELYEHQFATSGTLAYFDMYARKRNISLDQLRQRLEQTQAEYFRQIFQEAAAGGQYGPDFFERRLQIGKRHNLIDLPMKWYIGSYLCYQELVRKYLRKSFWYRPGFRTKAENAIFTVFNYDIQAVVDAFFYDYLQSIALDLSAIRIEDSGHDLSEYYGLLKSTLYDTTPH